MSETEEGDVTTPMIGGRDLNINLSEIKASQKKKLCMQILKLGTTILGFNFNCNYNFIYIIRIR